MSLGYDQEDKGDESTRPVTYTDEPCPALIVTLKSGEQHAVSYSYFRHAVYRPADGSISADFGELKINVQGVRLAPLFQRLSQAQVNHIALSEHLLADSNQAAEVVESIEVIPAKYD